MPFCSHEIWQSEKDVEKMEKNLAIQGLVVARL